MNLYLESSDVSSPVLRYQTKDAGLYINTVVIRLISKLTLLRVVYISCHSPLFPHVFGTVAKSLSMPRKRKHVNINFLPHHSAAFVTMRWPPDSSKDDDDKRSPVSWTDSLNATDWRHYTDPRTLIPTVLLTTTILLSVRLYRSYLRRIPGADYIRPAFFRKRSLFGTVTRVGDGDNFHLFHTPGGRLAGWGWFPGRKIPEDRKVLKGNTVRYACSRRFYFQRSS